MLKLIFLIFISSTAFAQSNIRHPILKRQVVADIYCEVFGAKPKVRLDYWKDKGMGKEYQEYYETQVRQLSQGTIGLVDIMNNVRVLKKNIISPPSGDCESLKSGKSLITHYNELSELYCEVLSDKISDNDFYFLDKLNRLYLASTSIEKLRSELSSQKDNYTKRGGSCEGLTKATYSTSTTTTGADTLEFEYITKAQRENTKFNSGINNGFSESQQKLALIESEFYDNVASGIKSCVKTAKSLKDGKCFEIDIRTKNAERKCNNLKGVEKANCIGVARDLGNSDLLKLGCDNLLIGEGNQHILYNLTETHISSLCTIKGFGAELEYDQKLNHPWYGTRKETYIKFNECLMDTCYSNIKTFYPKYEAKTKEFSKTDKTFKTLDYHCYERSGFNYCFIGLDLPGIREDHPVMKREITDKHRELAKRYGKLSVVNATNLIGKFDDGSHITSYLTFNLDNKGKLLNARLAATTMVTNWRPKVDEYNNPIFKDYDKLLLDWVPSIFAPDVKDYNICPIDNTAKVLQEKMDAINRDLYYQARALGCVKDGKVVSNQEVVGCDQDAISKLLISINATKQKLVDDTQYMLSGNADPKVEPTVDSLYVKYPQCKVKYPNIASLLTTDLTVTSEMIQEGSILDDTFNEQLAIVKKYNGDHNAIDKEFNEILARTFGLEVNAISVPTANAEISNGMIAETKKYETSSETTLPASYQRFKDGINRLDTFRKELKELYCDELGVDVDLSDKYFLDKFQKLAKEVFTNPSDTTAEHLANAKSHMIEQKAIHANDSSWNSNRKKCTAQ